MSPSAIDAQPTTSAQAQGKSRSPSPAPTAPTASTPGPRATALNNAFTAALSATLKKLSYTNFATCFPTPATYAPESLDGLYRQFVEAVEKSARGEFEEILREKGVVEGLNGLDGLVNNARKAKEHAIGEAKRGEVQPPTPMHMLPANELANLHLQPFLTSQKAEMEAQIKGVREANEALFEDVRRQRAEIEMLVAGLEGLVKDVTKAGDMVQTEDVAMLGEEVRALEGEMSEG